MKKIFWVILPLLVLAGAITYFTASRPEEKKHFTIGVVNPNHGSKKIHRGFIEGIQEAANLEGWELSFTICEDKNKIDAAIQEMVTQKVDMIFSVTTPATLKVRKAITGKGIAGIFAIYDPLGPGVIDSLHHPGGDLTGVQIRGSVPKALDWLLALAPKTQHLYVPIRLDTKAALQSLKDLQQSSQPLGISVTVAEVNNEAELDKALLSIPADTDAIFMLHSLLISTHARKIADMANAKKIPTAAAIGKSREGALISFCPELSKIGKQASRIARQVLKGETVGDTPTEIADFSLGINLQTAEKIGITVPNDILIMADDIVRD